MLFVFTTDFIIGIVRFPLTHLGFLKVLDPYLLLMVNIGDSALEEGFMV